MKKRRVYLPEVWFDPDAHIGVSWDHRQQFGLMSRELVQQIVSIFNRCVDDQVRMRSRLDAIETENVLLALLAQERLATIQQLEEWRSNIQRRFDREESRLRQRQLKQSIKRRRASRAWLVGMPEPVEPPRSSTNVPGYGEPREQT